jgi:hydrogenase maturation protein HypF
VDDGVVLLPQIGLFAQVAEELLAGVAPGRIAARALRGLAAGAASACLGLCERHDLWRIALSGGVFQNRVISSTLAAMLRREGVAVLEHQRVPANDGGISLGQVAVAAGRLRATSASAYHPG